MDAYCFGLPHLRSEETTQSLMANVIASRPCVASHHSRARWPCRSLGACPLWHACL